jgi:bifunctional DNA-binding transcriptional regulator/antitoxin component of YhaV-PrlF toxin-antitoxin module
VGSSKRVIIPQYLNEEFDWNKGNEVVIRRSGKIKLL